MKETAGTEFLRRLGWEGGSPFGEDQFDAGFFTAPNVCYKDIFTGFIFYKPLEQHYQRDGFPHEFDGFEDTTLKRAAYVDAASVRSFKYQIQRYKQNVSDPVNTDPLMYAYLYNLVTVRGVTMLLLLILFSAFLTWLFPHRLK